MMRNEVIMMSRDNFYNAACDIVKDVALKALHKGFKVRAKMLPYGGYVSYDRDGSVCHRVTDVRIEYDNRCSYHENNVDEMHCTIKCDVGAIRIDVSYDRIMIYIKSKDLSGTDDFFEQMGIWTEFYRWREYSDHNFWLTTFKFWLERMLWLSCFSGAFSNINAVLSNIIATSNDDYRESERRVRAVVSDDEFYADKSFFKNQPWDKEYRESYDDRVLLLPDDFDYKNEYQLDCWDELLRCAKYLEIEN